MIRILAVTAAGIFQENDACPLYILGARESVGRNPWNREARSIRLTRDVAIDTRDLPVVDDIAQLPVLRGLWQFPYPVDIQVVRPVEVQRPIVRPPLIDVVWRTDGGNTWQVCRLGSQSFTPCVVHAQKQAAVEAPVERCLQRMIVRTGSRLNVLNLAEALVGAQKIHRQRPRARNIHATRRSWVLVLSEVRRPISRGIEAPPLQEMRPGCADIRHVEHGLERQLVLYAKIEGIGCRDLALVVKRNESGRREQHRSRSNILHPSIKECRLQRNRRVLNEVENSIALRTIVEHAHATANDHALIAEDVVPKSESRCKMDTAIAVQTRFNALTRLQDAIRQLTRARHEPPDVRAIDRVGRCCNKTRTDQPRIHPAAIRAAARVGSDANRYIQERGIRRIKTAREEVGCLQALVILGLNPVKAHSVVERHP